MTGSSRPEPTPRVSQPVDSDDARPKVPAVSNLDDGVSVPTLAELAMPRVENREPARVGLRVSLRVSSKKRGRELGLVLESQQIGYTLAYSADGWVLELDLAARDAALAAIATYERENAAWPPPRVKDVPRHARSIAVLVAFAALTMFHVLRVAVPGEMGAWLARGRADSMLVLTEPWRMVTALTLHGDAQHVLGNAVSGTIFGTALARRIGPGGALLATAVAGALGNAANAVYYAAAHSAPHRSIGASTAVFATIGLLVGVELVRRLLKQRREPVPRMRRFVERVGPVVGGLALLGSLGASPDSDLGAHGFGLALGLLLGVPVGAIVNQSGATQGEPTLAPPGRLPQLALGAAAATLVIGSWALALA